MYGVSIIAILYIILITFVKHFYYLNKYFDFQ